MIAAALGKKDEARTSLQKALALNDHFDIDAAPIAKSLLAKVQ
jgi:hypothetical protein